jgi:tetratricopeptide (TPR) repeat protein
MGSLLPLAAYYPRHGHHAPANLWHNAAMSRHHPRAAPTTLEEHLRHMRSEFPNIRPFEEEDDLDWWNEGLDALEANQLQRAEKIFKKLALAQPEHFDGYYGLAQTYQRQQLIPQAILFADEAIRLAEAIPEDGSLDPSTILELKQFRLQLGPGSGPAA